MLRIPLLVFVCFFAHAGSVTFTLQCDVYPGSCNNKCYATYVAGKPASFIWNGSLGPVKAANRKAAGTVPNPCKCRKRTGLALIGVPSVCYDPDGTQVDCTSPDDYPYVSTPIGGQATGSAIIRCTEKDENRKEGRELGGSTTASIANGGCGNVGPCQIDLAFANVDQRSPFCTSHAGPNDGFEWAYNANGYNLAKRDEGNVSRLFEHHTPDPADFFPLHKRQEFLLDNGQRVIVASRDMQKLWEDETFFAGGALARVVRELTGMDKSPVFQPVNQTFQA